MPCNRHSSRIAVRRPTILSGKRSISVTVLVTMVVLSGLAGEKTSQDPVIGWMNGIAQQQLDQRAEKIRSIRTVDQAQARKQVVRAALLEDLGGLPDYHGPLHARVVDQIHNDNFTVEKVIYESLPGFYVTANLYRPNRPGRYPGVLMQAGHTQEGKPENQRLAANLAVRDL